MRKEIQASNYGINHGNRKQSIRNTVNNSNGNIMRQMVAMW